MEGHKLVLVARTGLKGSVRPFIGLVPHPHGFSLLFLRRNVKELAMWPLAVGRKTFGMIVVVCIVSFMCRVSGGSARVKILRVLAPRGGLVVCV